MTETRVYELTGAQARALETSLRELLPPDADWRRVDHAAFSVRAQGVTATYYKSGKLVVQGSGVDAFARRFLAGVGAPRPASGAPAIAFDRPTIGSDEAGKGDYFGPLVVAACFAEPTQTGVLRKVGVADSKSLGDRRMTAMAALLEQELDVEVRLLEPPDYNRRYARDPNVNHLLADLHAEAIAALLERHPQAGIVVDRFGSESLLETRLRRITGRAVKLLQVPRAEAHPVVAAASIVARIRFIEGLQSCADACGTGLHKGAGPPVDVAGRRVFRIGGRDLLAKVAKMHFKNTGRVSS